MRYLVHFMVMPEAGNKLEASGGTMPVIREVKERFKPEAIFAAVTLREFWMRINIDTPLDMSELTILSSKKFGSYPTLTPVLTEDELFEMLN